MLTYENTTAGNTAFLNPANWQDALSTNIYRGSAKVVWCQGINFDNTSHKVVFASNIIVANTNNSKRLIVTAQEVAYTFDTYQTNAWCFVYDTASSAFAFKSAGTTTINDMVLASIRTYGTGTTNGRVEEVCWCAIENWSMDGVNVNTRLTELSADTEIGIGNSMSLLGAELIQPEYTIRNGTIYNGKVTANNYCLCEAQFIPVIGGTTLEVIHANDISIRISEYSSAAESALINQTGYSKYDRITLQANTSFVRIAANYSDRSGISAPVGPSDYVDGDFGFRYYNSKNFKDLQEELGAVLTAPIDAFENKGYFVDGSTWKINNKYSVKIIPVTGGGKIVCTANSNIEARIAFLDSFNEAYILANAPCPIDGTGNQAVAIGQTKTFDIPNTCTYIALNSIYWNADSLPVGLIIDGKEYMKSILGAVADLTSKVIDDENTVTDYNSQVDGLQVGTFKSILGRNISRDAAVRATGQKVVNADILPLSFIHVSDIHTKANNYKCFESACEFYEHYSNIKAMIATGDLVWDSYADPMTYYDNALQKTTKPVLNIIGNHDAGQYKSAIGLGSVSTDKQCYDRYIAPYISAGTLSNGVAVPGWGVVQPTDAATNGNSYYYKDFTDEKVRLIVLCEFETEYEINPNDQTSLLYSRELRAMRQAQVTWLINTLTNTPSDYGVIIAMHQPLGSLANVDNEFVSLDLVGGYKFYVYSEDKEWLAKIINAYATKTSLTLSVTQTGAVVQNDAVLNCDCDFTNVQSEFICAVCGHTHRDYIGHLTNYPAVKVLCVGADNLLYTSGFQPRAEGTPSEDLFNVVNIDRNRKTIKIIRIGSDASITGQVRDQMIMSYATT